MTPSSATPPLDYERLRDSLAAAGAVVALAEQVEALAVWCQGFLSGVGTTAPAAVEGDALGEILRDFAEISRAGLSEDEEAGHDQPDFALAQIHEYVRVSVQLAFEELAPVRAEAAREVH